MAAVRASDARAGANTHAGGRAGALGRIGVAGLAAVAGVALGTATLAGDAAAAGPRPFLPAINLVWSHSLPAAGNPIAISSPDLVSLSGAPIVSVGDRAGNLWAFNVDDGGDPFGGLNPMYHAPGPIDSTPSQVPGQNGVVFGVGNAASSYGGGYFAVDAKGGLSWSQAIQNPPTDPSPFSAVAAGMAVGNAPGIGAFETSGSLGQELYALNPGGGVLGGFPFFQGDADFSTPAIGNLYNGSTPFIVDNADSSAGVAYGTTYTNGSILRVLNTSGQEVCQNTTTQSGESSPAIGQMTPNAAPIIVAGSSDFFRGATDTNKIFAWDAHCNRLWSDTLNGIPMAGPALANTQANGQLQVVEGTNVGNNNVSGDVYDLDASGHIIWQVPAAGAVIGSVATVDPANQGYQDLLVPTTAGVMVLDGKSGANLATIEPNEGFQSSPLVTTDSNGSIGITIAGYGAANQGVVDHFEIAGSTGNVRRGGARPAVDVLSQPGNWPMFHHDSQLTGNAGIAPPNLQVPCNAPVGALQGYYEVASDGGVFNFGNLPFCGSTGAITLNSPVVGIAATHDGGGYWMVAADGGIFAFGDAQFYGSMGGKPLNRPIVGMAVTADGGGYYLVASDGGIFAFPNGAGVTPFYGSMGGQPLNKPIVGMSGY